MLVSKNNVVASCRNAKKYHYLCVDLCLADMQPRAGMIGQHVVLNLINDKFTACYARNNRREQQARNAKKKTKHIDLNARIFPFVPAWLVLVCDFSYYPCVPFVSLR